MVDWRLGCDVVWKKSKSYSIFYFASCYMLPLSMMIYCYIRIIVIARNHARRIGDVNTRILVTAPTNNESKVDGENLSSISGVSHSYQNIKGKSTTTVRLVGLLVAFLLLWTPSFYSKLDESLSESEISRITKIIGCFAKMITLLSASVNPLIYALGSRKFRRTLRQKFRKKKLAKRGKSNMNLSIIYTEQLERRGELMRKEKLALDERLPMHIIENQELQIDSMKDIRTLGSLTSTSGKRSGTTETAL
ncbi:unnamed protein product [Dimorphilus gyrociliatus]|uniref:G-protein coupled receptors family 1 profile domain-containing protein n=1 Tax=Dimorphilus gyrociliatus TaxID=2664684 RepID=A0A7I8VSU6_9ANNE|nr:unnamed protein product [Dimorphilus gyrociliatus]